MHNCLVSSAGILHHQAARKSQPAVSAIGSVAPSQLHASDLNPKQKKNTVLSVSDRGKAASVSVPTSNNTGPASCTGEPGNPSLPQQNRCVYTHALIGGSCVTSAIEIILFTFAPWQDRF